MTAREKYKYLIENNPKYLIYKKKIDQIILEKGFSSIMNDTKWLELQHEVTKLSFPPAYVEKLVTEDENEENVKIEDYPRWFGDWSPFYEGGMSIFFSIKYIKVRAFYSEYTGQLINPKLIDETDKFREILKKLNIFFEEENKTFTIYGYR